MQFINQDIALRVFKPFLGIFLLAKVLARGEQVDILSPASGSV